MKKIFLLTYIIINTLSLKGMTFETKEIVACTRHSMYNADKALVASITSKVGSSLKIFTSSAFETLDKKFLPINVAHLITVCKEINAKQNLDEIVMLGDLYVPAEHRGKGYAKTLCDNVCKELFDKNFKKIVLIPDPFEYVDGKQKSIQDRAEYETKKKTLINLYKKCGFVEEYLGDVIYMYRDKVNI